MTEYFYRYILFCIKAVHIFCHLPYSVVVVHVIRSNKNRQSICAVSSDILMYYLADVHGGVDTDIVIAC